MNDKTTSAPPADAVGSRLDRGVGRPVPERAEDGTLLVLAAQAAGIEHAGWWPTMGALALRDPVGGAWNPLTDDGDALRLAIKLGLAVVPYPADVAALHNASGRSWAEIRGEDTYAATRRAIVRAAAALGAEKTPNGTMRRDQQHEVTDEH